MDEAEVSRGGHWGRQVIFRYPEPVAKRIAVLDWHDIQVLIQLSTFTVRTASLETSKCERARRHLIESTLSYLREWLPGKLIDDRARFKLVASLEFLYLALDPPSAEEEARVIEKLSPEVIRTECLRIRMKLLEAMGIPDRPFATDAPSAFRDLGGASACLAILGPVSTLLQWPGLLAL